jgi:hypothetical protein
VKTGLGNRKSFRITRLVLGMVALSLINRLPEAVKAGGEADEAAMARQVYNGKIAEKYNFRYGKSSLSCPRNATTDTGQFSDPKSFPTAEYCGHCHEGSHKQWRESAH